ncbi:hypothetical protein FBU30_009570 [Linnemannia zychae]|nr:hypothetical protein FBU30_009570 [Linnemannia zychae]
MSAGNIGASGSCLYREGYGGLQPAELFDGLKVRLVLLPNDKFSLRNGCDRADYPSDMDGKIVLESTGGDATQFLFYYGFIVATPRQEGYSNLNVPFLGLKGDASKIPVYNTDAGYPMVSKAIQEHLDIPEVLTLGY